MHSLICLHCTLQLKIISQTLQHHRQLRWIYSVTRGSAFTFEFVEQVGLCLDEQTLKQALRLFKESKPLLIANVDSIGTGTVRQLILIR
jgi:hypothetical protein